MADGTVDAALPVGTSLGLRPSGRQRLAIPALASAAFVYVTAEGLPVGLLGPMSSGLHVTPARIGLLVTIYAAAAGLAAVPVTAWMDRYGRRSVMTSAVALLALSQLAMAVAPDYAAVLAARVVCALAHGVFWSMLAPVAARLAPPERAGRATASVFVGNSLALVIGVPVGTALGQAIGWRGAMAAVGMAALVSAVAMRWAMDPLPRAGGRQELRAVPRLLRRRPLMALCAVTALVVIGHFTAYTYITLLIRRDTGLDGFALSVMLLVYGAAGVGGIALAGIAVDGRPRLSAGASAAGIAVALGMLAFVAGGSLPLTVAAVAVWGAAFTALPACLQAAVLRVAPDAADTASALYVVAFQVGIGGGALAGSGLVAAGHLGTLPVVGMALAGAGTIVVCAARRAFPAAPPPVAAQSR